MSDSEGSIDSAPVRAGATAQRWRAAAPGLVVVAIAVAALVDLRGVPFGAAQHLGPAAVPDILGGLLLFLGIVIAVEGLFGRRIGGGE